MRATLGDGCEDGRMPDRPRLDARKLRTMGIDDELIESDAMRLIPGTGAAVRTRSHPGSGGSAAD